MNHENLVSFIAGAISTGVITYFANKAAKFNEFQIQLMMEKLKKYDSFLESHFRLTGFLKVPGFLENWNGQGYPQLNQSLIGLSTQVYQQYSNATLFMSEEIGIINEYILKKHAEIFKNQRIESQVFSMGLKDIDEKIKLMSDLIKVECSKDVLMKELLYGSFFNFDLAFSNRLEKLRSWRNQNNQIFEEIKDYVDRNSYLPVQ